MREFYDALEQFRKDDLKGYDFVRTVRRIGPEVADLLLAEVFTGGVPHEGAYGNPAWDSWKQSYLVQALGATRSDQVIPWLEFAIHFASDLDCEGSAAEALGEIGTETAMYALVEGALCTGAVGDEGEAIYDVIVEHAAQTLPIIQDLLENSGFAQNKLNTLLEICVEMGGEEWQPAKAWIKNPFWEEDDEDEDTAAEGEDNVIGLSVAKN